MSMNTNQRGYTLIELIVSVAIFSIVMLVAGAAFIALISLDRKARATNDVVTNLSYVVDSMERSVRTGTNYTCTSCWPNPSNEFAFTDAQGRTVSYRLLVTGTQGQVQQQISGGGWNTLTDPRIDVERLDFYARGATRGDSVQPTVVFVIRGLIRPDSTSLPVDFTIESGATQRLIDI